jgi:hypothetical protein
VKDVVPDQETNLEKRNVSEIGNAKKIKKEIIVIEIKMGKKIAREVAQEAETANIKDLPHHQKSAKRGIIKKAGKLLLTKHKVAIIIILIEICQNHIHTVFIGKTQGKAMITDTNRGTSPRKTMMIQLLLLFNRLQSQEVMLELENFG